MPVLPKPIYFPIAEYWKKIFNNNSVTTIILYVILGGIGTNMDKNFRYNLGLVCTSLSSCNTTTCNSFHISLHIVNMGIQGGASIIINMIGTSALVIAFYFFCKSLWNSYKKRYDSNPEQSSTDHRAEQISPFKTMIVEIVGIFTAIYVVDFLSRHDPNRKSVHEMCGNHTTIENVAMSIIISNDLLEIFETIVCCVFVIFGAIICAIWKCNCCNCFKIPPSYRRLDS